MVGILTVKAQRGFEIGPGLAEIGLLHLVLAGDEIGGSGDRRVALLLDRGQRVGVHLAVVDNLVADFRLALQIVGRSKRGNVFGALAAAVEARSGRTPPASTRSTADFGIA